MRTPGRLVSCGRHPVVLRSFSQMARHFKRVCSVWSVKSYTSFLRFYYCGDGGVCFATVSFLLLGLPVCVLGRDSVLGAPGRCRGWAHAAGGALEAWPQ